MAQSPSLIWQIVSRLGLGVFWFFSYTDFAWGLEYRNLYDITLSSLLLIFGLALLVTPKKIYKINYWSVGIALFIGLTVIKIALWQL